MFQRTSSAAYAHMGKSKRDWQTGGPIRREYVHGTAYGYNKNRRTCTSMWVELEGANQILHISERGQSTYVFTYTRTYIDWYRLVCTYAHVRKGAHVRIHVKGKSNAQTSCRGPIRTLGTHLKIVHGNGSEEFFEDFLKKLIQRVQDCIVVKPSGTEIIKSHRIQIKPTPIWE